MCSQFWRFSLQQRDKSLSLQISSSTAASQFLILFPAYLYFALCFFSCVFSYNANPDIFPCTHISLGPPVPVPSCPLRRATSFLLPWKAPGIPRLFSCAMHRLCGFVPFLGDCLCHTKFSHQFSSRNYTFSCSTYTYHFMLLPALSKKFLLLLLCWQQSTAMRGVILSGC